MWWLHLCRFVIWGPVCPQSPVPCAKLPDSTWGVAAYSTGTHKRLSWGHVCQCPSGHIFKWNVIFLGTWGWALQFSIQVEQFFFFFSPSLLSFLLALPLLLSILSFLGRLFWEELSLVLKKMKKHQVKKSRVALLLSSCYCRLEIHLVCACYQNHFTWPLKQ